MTRLIELLERLVAPGPAGGRLSASEFHELYDDVHELLDHRHGQEAEELRGGLESLRRDLANSNSSEEREIAGDVQQLLDRVDARDALAYLKLIQLVGPKHLAHVEPISASYRRGGSSRTARCTCGWKGPERATLDLAADDAISHERMYPSENGQMP